MSPSDSAPSTPADDSTVFLSAQLVFILSRMEISTSEKNESVKKLFESQQNIHKRLHNSKAGNLEYAKSRKRHAPKHS